MEEFGGDLGRLLSLPLAELRPRLLGTYGIGEETADDILVYAAGLPSFVVDAYTERLFARLGLGPQGSRYRDWQAFFMAHLAPDAALYNEYHALIVRHGVLRCRKRSPVCHGCPLLDRCPTGQDLSGASAPQRAARLAAQLAVQLPE
jgi:endonuclease-3 related protein